MARATLSSNSEFVRTCKNDCITDGVEFIWKEHAMPITTVLKLEAAHPLPNPLGEPNHLKGERREYTYQI